jgi:hypothetical protein
LAKENSLKDTVSVRKDSLNNPEIKEEATMSPSKKSVKTK